MSNTSPNKDISHFSRSSRCLTFPIHRLAQSEERNFQRAEVVGELSAQKSGCLFDKRHGGTDVNAGGHTDQ